MYNNLFKPNLKCCHYWLISLLFGKEMGVAFNITSNIYSEFQMGKFVI